MKGKKAVKTNTRPFIQGAGHLSPDLSNPEFPRQPNYQAHVILHYNKHLREREGLPPDPPPRQSQQFSECQVPLWRYFFTCLTHKFNTLTRNLIKQIWEYGEALSATDSVVEEVKEVLEDESINSTSLEVACPKTTKDDFFSLSYGELFSSHSHFLCFLFL